MTDVKDIYSLLPKVDCGLCRNSDCWTFARRVYASLQKAPECLCNQEIDTKKIEDLVGKGISLTRKKGEPKVVEFQPCGEYGKITLESQMPTIDESPFDLFDPEEMCLLLRDAPLFTDIKCSVEAGYSMFTSLGGGAHAFKTGKMIVRRATDKTSALKTLSTLRRVLWGSVVCSCGNTASNYGGGAVKNCTQQIFQPLIWGFSRPETEMVPLGEVLPETPSSESGKTFSKALKELGPIVESMSSLLEKVSKGAKIDVLLYRNQIETRIERINKLALIFLNQTKRDEEASLGLVLNGLALDLTRTSKSLSLTGESDRSLLKTALEISVAGLKSITDTSDPKDVFGTYNDFREKWNNSSRDTNIFKIANNGSYMAAITLTKFPR